jgi:hypothetical protein
VGRLDPATARLDLTNSRLGIMLPAFPIGAIVAFQLLAVLSNRVQSRTTLVGFGLMRAAVFPLLGLTGSMAGVTAALLRTTSRARRGPRPGRSAAAGHRPPRRGCC